MDAVFAWRFFKDINVNFGVSKTPARANKARQNKSNRFFHRGKPSTFLPLKNNTQGGDNIDLVKQYISNNSTWRLRNVNSKYLKCIASQCSYYHSLVCCFAYETSMAEEQESLCNSFCAVWAGSTESRENLWEIKDLPRFNKTSLDFGFLQCTSFGWTWAVKTSFPTRHFISFPTVASGLPFAGVFWDINPDPKESFFWCVTSQNERPIKNCCVLWNIHISAKTNLGIEYNLKRTFYINR